MLSVDQLIIAHRYILRYYDERIARAPLPAKADLLRLERERWRTELLERLEP